MARFQKLVKSPIRWISRHSYLLLSLLITSCLQAIILAFGDFGSQAILANVEQLPGIKVSHIFIFNYLNQLGVIRIVWKITNGTVLLFLIQLIPTSIYSCFQSIRGKRIASLIIWLLPALISLHAVEGTVAYLMSPLFAIGISISLLGDFTKEDFAEGLIFYWAAIGWFNLFWLGVTIRNWFFPKERL